MIFEEAYYEDEVREGFLVTSAMKRCWAAQLEVYEAFAKFCQWHGITFYVDYGTLLGAVRHKGFIPWDDDMDISMNRENYNRFLELAVEELGDSYEILSPITNQEWNYPFARMCNTASINGTVQHLKKYHGFPYPAGVDIIPLDPIPEEQDELDVQRQIISILYRVACVEKISLEEQKRYEELICQVESLCGKKFDRLKSFQNQVARIIDELACNCPRENPKYFAYWGGLWDDMKWALKKEWYQDIVYLPFEGIRVPAPVGYKELLTAIYGDYMTPVRGVADHEYPYFEKYRQILRDMNVNEKDIL